MTQPWGSLMIDNAPNPRKRIETRSWRTNYRGPLAIHAAKSVDEHACSDFGYNAATIPLGVILGTVELYECFEFNLLSIQGISDEEKQYGNYEFGRFGFRCRNAVKFDIPVLAKGRLHLWDWSPNGTVTT
jgi:activating signal cointegrator 1